MRRHLTTIMSVLLAVVTTLGLLTACGGDDGDSGARSGETTEPTVEPTTDESDDEPEDGAACDRPVEDPPQVDPVADVDTDHTLVSFDDTAIRIHWFPSPSATADEPAPTVLSGPGWSLAGETSLDGAILFGSVGIGALNDRGYNVLTWDPRGFGESDGTVTIDHPDLEGRDVSRIIDWLASLPEVELDAPGDPRIGMIGSSYGGGIQLAVASHDCRVDALVPGLAWNSLESSLYLNETVKTGWGLGLVQAAAGADLDPHIQRAIDAGLDHGRIDDEDIDWFIERGPGETVGDIDAPTLLVHGTTDTLFPPGEAITNHRLLTDAGTPTALVWFCGGHGVCLTGDGDTDFVESATLAWLDRWLRDEDVDLPPAIQIVDQHGDLWAGDELPEPDSSSAVGIGAGGSGSLELTEDGGAGPLEEAGDGLLAGLVTAFTPARADHAAELPIGSVDGIDGLVLGEPILRLTYTGTHPDGPSGPDDRPDRIFAQLIDESDGRVIGNQITPIPVELDGEEHTIEIPLEVVAHRIRSGDTLTLQLVATTVAYATPRMGGSIEFGSIEVELPVITDGLAICDGEAAGLGCPPLR